MTIAQTIVSEFNEGKSFTRLSKEYPFTAKVIEQMCMTSGEQLLRPHYCTEAFIKHKAKEMCFDDLAFYLNVTPDTLRKHCKMHSIKLPKFISKDDLYIEKQVIYLYFKNIMSKKHISESLHIQPERVAKIVRKATKNGMSIPKLRMISPQSASITESGGKMIEYHDLANVFPKYGKTGGYNRAY